MYLKVIDLNDYKKKKTFFNFLNTFSVIVWKNLFFNFVSSEKLKNFLNLN